LTKNFTKGYRSVVTHVLYHFCDMSLITACAIFCSLKFHVVCTCTFFRDIICLLTNRKMIKIVTLIDLHIVLTYDCWHCFLVFNIWVSHALEMRINFYHPTLELFCFSFTQPFTHSKFCLPNPFLFDATVNYKNSKLYYPFLLIEKSENTEVVSNSLHCWLKHRRPNLARVSID
jgi:hypothetical protein